MTDEQIVQVQKMRDEGMTYRKIAVVTGVPKTTIQWSLSSEEYRKAARERHRIHQAEYYKAHKDDEALRERERKRGRKLRKDHKEEVQLYQSNYRKTHKKEMRLYQIDYRKTHKKEIRLIAIRHYKGHKPKFAALCAARRALVAGATIGNLVEIKEIYRQAKEDPRVRCYLCGDLIPLGYRHVDHIMPVSRGGAHRPSNLAVACDRCNFEKHDKLPEEIGVLL